MLPDKRMMVITEDADTFDRAIQIAQAEGEVVLSNKRRLVASVRVPEEAETRIRASGAYIEEELQFTSD